MVQYNRLDLQIKIDGINFDLPASNYPFIVYDSINELYPRAKISFGDISGIYNEYMAFINGSKIELSFGTEERKISCPFVVERNSIPNQVSVSSVGGVTETTLIHHYFAEQERRSGGYQQEMSQVIKNLISKYPFSKINIEQTLNKGPWYQPYINDAEFIQTLLLPFAYSTYADDTPFFSFISADNSYNFKSFKKLYVDENPLDIIFLNIGSGTYQDLTRNVGFVFNPTQSSIIDLRQIINRKLVEFNSNGEMTFSYEKLQEYLTDASSIIPIKWKSSLTTGIKELLPNDLDINSTKNNNLGLRNNSMKEAFLLDKMIVTTNFNPSYVAGKLIELRIPIIREGNTEEISLRFSGNYIIESTYHRWSGRSGVTTLVLSRQATKQNKQATNTKMTLGQIG